MIQRIKMEHCFDSKGLNIKDGVQDGRHLVSKDLSDPPKKAIKKHFNFEFLLLFRG